MIVYLYCPITGCPLDYKMKNLFLPRISAPNSFSFAHYTSVKANIFAQEYVIFSYWLDIFISLLATVLFVWLKTAFVFFFVRADIFISLAPKKRETIHGKHQYLFIKIDDDADDTVKQFFKLFFKLRSQRLAKCLQCVKYFLGYCTMTTIIWISKIGRTFELFFLIMVTCAFINLVPSVDSIISGYYLLPSNELH